MNRANCVIVQFGWVFALKNVFFASVNKKVNPIGVERNNTINKAV